MNTHKKILLIIGLCALVSTVLGFTNYAENNFSGISWPFIWMGIFIWGDAMILGTFLFISCIFLWFKNNSTFTGMLFSAYVFIRSSVEILYNLNAQFSTISRPWETFVPQIASALHLEKAELYVLPQITYTAISTVALISFCYFLKKYFKS